MCSLCDITIQINFGPVTADMLAGQQSVTVFCFPDSYSTLYLRMICCCLPPGRIREEEEQEVGSGYQP